MKRLLPLLLLLITVLSYSFKPAQNNSRYFVQFKINSISSNDQAMVIDQNMKLKQGIQITRTDYISSTYFCVLKPQIQYSKEDFIKWFEKLGYEITCYNTGIQGVDKSISPYILKDCKDEK
jgi:hypothetical protein